MPKALILLLALFSASLLTFNTDAFAAEPAAATSAAPQTAVVLTAAQTELLEQQQSINADIETLKFTKGELNTITKFKIQSKTALLRNQIKSLLDESTPDTAFLLPLLQTELKHTQQIDAYLTLSTNTLGQQLGSSNDNSILLAISKIELEKDNNFKLQLETLNWLNQIGQDVSADIAKLKATLTARADNFEGFINYTQEQLQLAVNIATNAGKDVTAEQTLRVQTLKDRLDHNSQSLSIDINLLDSLGQDTASLKKTLFSISGDITQDVLNIDVVSSLLAHWLDTAQTKSIENGPTATFKLFIFFLILFIANLAGKLAQKLVKNMVSNSKLNFSKLLQDFFTSLSAKAVFTIGLLIALSQLGIELGPLLAGFGIAGVIIGFALQDTLSNFASGMMILIYRPYDVGDLINAAGVSGRVSHMSLVSTTIKTLDNQRLIIPNNKIWGDTINNITAEDQRRVDMVFGISYSDNIEHAETILKSIVAAHPKVLPTPEPTIRLHTLGESSVDFIVRPCTNPEDYWDVYWDITRQVKLRFDAEGISIPFPQRDVHIYQTSK
ncbi:MAG: mechanosensitive ion channel family protein [Shewanella sp.]